MKSSNFESVKKTAKKAPGIPAKLDISKSQTQRVLPFGNGWIVKSDADKDFHVVTLTQREAIKIAKSFSENRHGFLIIHGKDGRIKDTVSYLNDAKSPGKKKKAG